MKPISLLKIEFCRCPCSFKPHLICHKNTMQTFFFNQMLKNEIVIYCFKFHTGKQKKVHFYGFSTISTSLLLRYLVISKCLILASKYQSWKKLKGPSDLCVKCIVDSTKFSASTDYKEQKSIYVIPIWNSKSQMSNKKGKVSLKIIKKNLSATRNVTLVMIISVFSLLLFLFFHFRHDHCSCSTYVCNVS